MNNEILWGFAQITTAFLLGGLFTMLVSVGIGSIWNAGQKGRAW